MKKFACQYAIVRFLPYLETGEFANVGIVMLCPDAGFFDFKLLLTRVRRITAFFEELDSGIYRRAAKDFKQELNRIRNWIAHQPGRTMDVELARHLFGELTRQREAMMRFDNVRVVLADDPAQQMEELFGHYVERNFATKAYHEQLLDKTVRNVLMEAKLNKQYQPETLGDVTTYHAKLPFVHRDGVRAVKAIKPLFLAHEDPAQIYDHGWAWLGKVEKLRALHLLPEQVLFPVQGPVEVRGERFDMFQEITAKMAANDVWVVPSIQTERIVEFARI